MNLSKLAESTHQRGLFESLIICERLFYIYCEYSGREKGEIRELLDELWSIDLVQETYNEADVTSIQSFITSLYPESGSGNEYVGSGFLVSLVDIYDYIVENDENYIESIKHQCLDSIRHHLECALFKDGDAPREISKEEHAAIESSDLIQKEVSAQKGFSADLLQGLSIDEIKTKYIYNPIAPPINSPIVA
jgi:hypothetical protein